MAVKASSYKLNIWCKKHPEYRGIRMSKRCGGCRLIWIFLHNPIGMHFTSLLDDLRLICVKSQSFPVAIKLTKRAKEQRQAMEMHYVGCPGNQRPGELASCICSELARE